MESFFGSMKGISYFVSASDSCISRNVNFYFFLINQIYESICCKFFLKVEPNNSSLRYFGVLWIPKTALWSFYFLLNMATKTFEILNISEIGAQRYFDLGNCTFNLCLIGSMKGKSYFCFSNWHPPLIGLDILSISVMSVMCFG